MKTIMDELNSVKVRKHIVTTIEYDCKKSDKADQVFDAVRDIVTDHLDEIAKITYDILPAEKKVRVEVSQNK